MPVPLTVKDLRVSSLSVHSHEIRWVVSDTRDDVLDYTFQVLRSEGSAGPWDPISPEMEDRYFFVDNAIDLSNRWRVYNYLLRVKQKKTGDVLEAGPVAHEAKPDLVAGELRNHFHLLMHEFVGRRCWILQRRTFGPRCTQCFDPTLKAKTRSGCSICFDTSYVRGFYTPIEAYIQIDPSTATNQNSNIGKIQQDTTTARLGYFPQLKPGDMFIEGENIRWKVTKVNSTQRLRAVVHQEVSIYALPKSDIEYAVDIDFGTGTVKTWRGEYIRPVTVDDLSLAGPRNFTNPQTLEAAEEACFEGVLGLYGSRSAKLKP